ncbi:hypothetical protein FSP39_023318 [Pinctada imbricata]|uniref:Phospholipid/glycerol acyltransferase domain-containing protein n=1 Tax=Pinctada imbricata TaxID=66713 RepID=A0AA89C613_PINIB|nr:hypothetical protein FSP39_023318 [Pinctada imbricata]
MTDKKTITSDLEAVYAKWENRGPRGSNSGPKPGGSKTNEMVERIVREGRQRWTDRFGDSIKPVAHRKSRLKNRNRIVAISTEEVTSKVIAQFKTTPMVTPESLIVTRPFMGTCCSCMPNSQIDFIKSNTAKRGLRDLLNVQSQVTGDSFAEKHFKKVVYILRKKHYRNYSDVSLQVLTSARLERKPEHLLNSMRAAISNLLISLTGWSLLTFLPWMLRTIVVHQGQLEMVKKASDRGLPVIYLPLHKSHLDYILITFILWHFDIKAPHVAAGDNLDIPLFGRLMKGLGGFFIRRKLDKKAGKKDHIYRAVLHSYMQQLLIGSESMEFFIEGGRSRSGKALAPKLGLMSVIVETLNKGLIEDAYIVPLGISYEKIIDGNFNSEQMGVPKKKETFFGALRAIWGVLSTNFGSVRVDFAQPFSLKEYMQTSQTQSPPLSMTTPGSDSENQSDTDSLPPSPPPLKSFGSSSSLYGTDIVEEDQRHVIKKLGEHIVFTCVNTTAPMCTNLLAFLLLTKHRQGADMKTVIQDFDWLKSELKNRKRDVGFCGNTDEIIHYASCLLGPNLVTVKTNQETGCKTVEPKLELPDLFELSYYSNSVISVFLLESVLACSVIYNCDVSLGSPDEGYGQEACSASRDDILQTAMDICHLLRYEFTFIPPCQKLEDTVSDHFDEMVTMEILKLQDVQGDSYSQFDQGYSKRLSATMSWADELDDPDTAQEMYCKVNAERQDCVDKLRFLHRVTAPLLETYYVTACQISKILITELPEDDFTRTVHKAAKDRVQDGIASYGESAALDSVKNAIKAFQDVKIIDIYYAGNLRMVELHDHFEVRDRLNSYIDLLESLRD